MWRLRIGIAFLIALNIAAHVAVTLALRRTSPIFFPSQHELLELSTVVLWSVQFAAALFCMTYSRFAAPWRHLWCTFWVVSAALLFELRHEVTLPDVTWMVIIGIISLWTGYAFFVLGRWYFGTEFAPGNVALTHRQWILSGPVIKKWLVIVVPIVIGNLILSQLTPPKSIEIVMPIWSAALGYAVMHSLFYFPLFFAMLMRRFAWILFGVLALMFVVMVMVDVIQTVRVNPPFALQKLEHALISMTPPLIIAFTFRFLGLRWQESIPWPAPARPALETTPNPFA